MKYKKRKKIYECSLIFVIRSQKRYTEWNKILYVNKHVTHYTNRLFSSIVIKL